MEERGYREYECTDCGASMWIHIEDPDDTEVWCSACGARGVAGDVRRPKVVKENKDATQ